ncbi:hypothetical protein ATANTOWER_012791 [Ataeniobius toweri]|uniref:Uncharacterized protein n=1 Tax=Ataeniobius toweri TaxID=208326 RepID=A0ABU7BQZ9_9TELE|nr:hypothetical protein [Ataeniobius toweri]
MEQLASTSQLSLHVGLSREIQIQKVLKFKRENVKKSRGKNNLARSTFPHLIFQRTPQTSPNMQWKSFRKCYFLSSIEAENLNLILKQPLSQTPPSLTCNKLSFLLFDSSSFWS